MRHMLAATAAAVVVAVSGSGNAYPASALIDEQRVNRSIICKVFGRYCAQALAVSWCESRWNRWATNGQYLGLFQMGSYARARYGHSVNNSWIQARAARAYFYNSGRDWSPWSCKPW